jgi:hypothetical protein
MKKQYTDKQRLDFLEKTAASVGKLCTRPYKWQVVTGKCEILGGTLRNAIDNCYLIHKFR